MQLLSPKGLAQVVQNFELRITTGLANPRIGRPTPRDDVRELVESKYGFLIPYYVKNNVFYVLRIYSARRRPLDYGALTLP